LPFFTATIVTPFRGTWLSALKVIAPVILGKSFVASIADFRAQVFVYGVTFENVSPSSAH